jgi:hypothetical protein
VIAASLGAIMVLLYVLHTPLGSPGPDIDQIWFAARSLLAGDDPYQTVSPANGFSFLLYDPLPAALVAIPLAVLPLEVARFTWTVATAALFGYAIGRKRPELWAVFMGAPFLIGLRNTQWAPLMTTAMLLPALGWIAPTQPSLGVAMLAWCRTRRAALIIVAGGFALVLVSLAFNPRWPLEWREAFRQATHIRPLVLRPGGFLMLLALCRWRDPDARLLLALALVPVSGLFYDILPAVLVARTRVQAMMLMLFTLVGWQALRLPGFGFETLPQQMWYNGMVVLWFGLIPPLVLVLLRAEWLARWRRGRRAEAPAHEKPRLEEVRSGDQEL